MTLLDLILLKHGWTPEQLGIEPPERDGRREPLRLKGVIDSQPGRTYSRESQAIRWAASNGRKKRA